jgi:hypothetical protein
MGVRNLCYVNGVKIWMLVPVANYSAYVTKADGVSRCYYLAASRASMPSRLVYRDSRDQEVATIVFPSEQATKGVATCFGRPGTWEVDLASPACAASGNGIAGEAGIMCPVGGTCDAPIPPLDP